MNTEQLEKIKTGSGFISALDQSGGSTPKALKAYGIDETEYNNDAEMFDRIHEMRTRIITSKSFSGSRILASVNYNGLRIVRGSTAIRQFWCYNQNGNWDSDMIGTMHEDTPGAGTHTYKIQQFTDTTTSQHLLNYIGNASNSDGLAQIHIYLMEIKS